MDLLSVKSWPLDPVFMAFIIKNTSKILESIWHHLGKILFLHICESKNRWFAEHACTQLFKILKFWISEKLTFRSCEVLRFLKFWKFGILNFEILKFWSFATFEILKFLNLILTFRNLYFYIEMIIYLLYISKIFFTNMRSGKWLIFH